MCPLHLWVSLAVMAPKKGNRGLSLSVATSLRLMQALRAEEGPRTLLLAPLHKCPRARRSPACMMVIASKQIA